MDILKLIKETIENLKLNSFNKSHIEKLLDSISKTIENDKKIILSLNLKIIDKNEAIKKLEKEYSTNNEKLEKALAHCEFIEPLFERFKKKSIGRLELLTISKESKINLKNKIEKASYSDEIMQVLVDIELKCLNDFSNKKIKVENFSSKKIINPKDYKSGR